MTPALTRCKSVVMIAQPPVPHAFNAHTQYLDNALFISGDAGEIGTVKDRFLNRSNAMLTPKKIST